MGLAGRIEALTGLVAARSAEVPATPVWEVPLARMRKLFTFLPWRGAGHRWGRRALDLARFASRAFEWPAAPVTLALSLLAVFYGTYSVVQFGVVGHKGTRVYYDAYHGARHLWNRDNLRHHHAYHTVSGYNRFYRTLQEAGFEVDVASSHGFDRDQLEDYDVFFVGEQTNHGRFMTDREVEDLRDWVEDGGGLFAMAEHSNAFFMTDVFNRLFRGWPVKARNDTISERGRPPPFPPAWVTVSAPDEPHPAAEGVREYILFAGCSMDTPHGILFTSEDAWADYYQANKPPVHNGDGQRQSGELPGPLAGAAAFDQGDGRVVVAGDHNAFSNPNLYWGDHHRFATQSFHWLAGRRLNRDFLLALAGLGLLAIYFRRSRRRQKVAKSLVLAAVVAAIGVAGWSVQQPRYADLLVFRGNSASMHLMTKQPAGYYKFHGVLTKEPHLRPWAKGELEPGYDALFLAGPTDSFDEDQLGIIDGYLAQGRTVVYLATQASLESDAGLQLQEHFGFSVERGKPVPIPKGAEKAPYSTHGPETLLASIHRFWVQKKTPSLLVQGLEPVVYLTPGSENVNDEAWEDQDPAIHVLSERPVGPGTFALVAPIELFSSKGFGDLYKPGNPIQEQMSEFVLRVVNRATARRGARLWRFW